MCWTGDSRRSDDLARLRREVVAYLRLHGGPREDYAAAELIAGELLSNAGRYSPGPVSVEIGWAQACARISVRDSGRGFAWEPVLPREDSESGRGLFIVSQLGSEVVVECDRTGCCVSATLPVRRSDAKQSL